MSKKRDGKQMAEETIRMSRGISPVAAEIISEIITGFRNPNRPPGSDGRLICFMNIFWKTAREAKNVTMENVMKIIWTEDPHILGNIYQMYQKLV
jgi:hypothetical protein